jgi:hypothetical protein
LISAWYGTAQAQFVVSDPVHTGITTAIKLLQDPSFKELVGNVKKLMEVASAVQQFNRGRELVTNAHGAMSDMNKMASVIAQDRHIHPKEFSRILAGFQRINNEGSSIVVAASNALVQRHAKMTDAERIEWLESMYQKISDFRGVVNEFYGSIRKSSLSRARTNQDRIATAKLYGLALNGSTYHSGLTSASYGIPISGIHASNYDVIDSGLGDTDAQGKEDAKKIAERMTAYQSELRITESIINADIVDMFEPLLDACGNSEGCKARVNAAMEIEREKILKDVRASLQRKHGII